MVDQVLARKWRPRTFQDMVGQEHILRILTNALSQQRIHHAYLFTGTRGIGKTTVARIFAKCLNCEAGISATPCGQCHACNSIDAGQFLDLYEIDAASRTKVEDTRELLENVCYPPTQGRYKIYLIDEVHMLSTHSFNALLKTLEEPPSHAKFILATTDPKRLPITILSRCLQFHLKRMLPEQMSKHLQQVCTAEKIEFNPAALERIAIAADGSMRDALSLLDQAIAYGQGIVKQEEVLAMLGCLAQEDLLPLLTALAAHDGNKLFAEIRLLAERAPDFTQLLAEIINIFHELALMQIIPHHANAKPLLLPLSQSFSSEEIQLYYQIALLSRRDLNLTPSPQQGFEMAMLRMLAFKPTQERTIIRDDSSSCSTNTTTTTTEQPPKKPVQTAAWRDLLPNLGLSGMAYALAANCSLTQLTENTVELTLSANHQPMLNQKLKDRIAEALSRYYQKTMQVDITIAKGELDTPIRQQQQENDQRVSQTKQAMLQDNHIKALLDMYDGSIDVSLQTES